MLFLTPRYLKEARQLRHGARKLLNYRRDLLPEKRRLELEAGIASLDDAIRRRDRKAAEESGVALNDLCADLAPASKHAAWAENLEVILVAVVLACGIRAFYLQPFKIPTGSMQPTLNGIIGTPSAGPPPNLLRQAFDLVFLGRNHVDLVSKSDGNAVVGLREFRRFHFFTFTEVVTRDGRQNLMVPQATLTGHFGIDPRRTYAKGEVIARGRVDTGDHLFVDKVSYHFRLPHRSDVFVFRTTGIARIEQTIDPRLGSQYYIKRLCGMPGDQLRISPPTLFVNGQPAQEPLIQRVIAAQQGYRGYSNASEHHGRLLPPFDILGDPEAVFRVPDDAYFALGDNSYNSSDSRHWGTVPQDNITGRGFFVYWPPGKHWGFIR